MNHPFLEDYDDINETFDWDVVAKPIEEERNELIRGPLLGTLDQFLLNAQVRPSSDNNTQSNQGFQELTQSSGILFPEQDETDVAGNSIIPKTETSKGYQLSELLEESEAEVNVVENINQEALIDSKTNLQQQFHLIISSLDNQQVGNQPTNETASTVPLVVQREVVNPTQRPAGYVLVPGTNRRLCDEPMICNNFLIPRNAWAEAFYQDDIVQSAIPLFNAFFTPEEMNRCTLNGKSGTDSLCKNKINVIYLIVGWMRNKKRDPYSYGRDLPTEMDSNVADNESNQLSEDEKKRIKLKVFVERRSQCNIKFKKQNTE